MANSPSIEIFFEKTDLEVDADDSAAKMEDAGGASEPSQKKRRHVSHRHLYIANTTDSISKDYLNSGVIAPRPKF